jgi:hypothetical protein
MIEMAIYDMIPSGIYIVCSFLSSDSRYRGHLVGGTTTPIPSKHTTGTQTEAKEQSNEGSEGKPIGVTVVGRHTGITIAVSYEAEQGHIDNPDYKGYDSSK